MSDLPTPKPAASRIAAAVALAAASWGAVLGLGITALKASWPAYAAAAPDRSYTLAMLVCRLVLYGSAIAATSFVAGRVAGDERLSWFAGAVIFALSVPPHLYPGYVWDDFPVWYHLGYLASVLPIALCAGRFLPPGVPRRSRS